MPKGKDSIKITALAPSQVGSEIVVQTKPLNELKRVPNPVHVYSSDGSNASRRRGVFREPEYDLYEISRLEDVESLVRQGNSKKIGLFMKEGFDLVGKDKRFVKYLKARFNQIAHASSIPFNELIRRTVTQLIKKSNAFLIKVRRSRSSGGKSREDTLTGKKLDPVAGYFPAPPETMEPDVDNFGRVLRWRQRLPNGQTKEFRPEDVVHFTFDRKEGFLFGTPIIVPVIDDIKSLRNIEVNIEMLIYKHLFPLFQYKVGTDDRPAGFLENGVSEIDNAYNIIREIPDHGAIVTPERHEIIPVGAENQALRAQEYLLYFRERVIAGLGMSEVDFGNAKTVNRSTADNLSRALVDSVKDMQDTFEAQFCEFIIKELMLESTFGESVLEEENKVRLKFKEIDIDKQIKVQKHALEVFQGYGTTFDEYRVALGLDPIPVPDDPHDQDPASFPEWHKTYWKLISEPENMIRAVDEPFGAASQSLAEATGSAVTPPQLQKGQQAQEKLAKIQKPPKPPAKKTRDTLGDDEFFNIADLVNLYLRNRNTDEVINLRQITGIETLINRISEKIQASMMANFVSGMNIDVRQDNLHLFTMARRIIASRADLLLRRLFFDLQTLIRKRDDSVDAKGAGDTIPNIRVIFDSLHFRLKWIVDTETKKSFNLGRLMNFRFNNITEAMIQKSEDACERCAAHDGMLISTMSFQDMNNVLPNHPSCRCKFVPVKND